MLAAAILAQLSCLSLGHRRHSSHAHPLDGFFARGESYRRLRGVGQFDIRRRDKRFSCDTLKKVMASDGELSVENLSEDHWLVLDRSIPADADPQLLTAARDPAVVCQLELQLERPSSPDLKKIDAILTDIRNRLGEPEPKPIEPGMKATLDELEKKWTAQPDRQRDRGC
jgi:hypothetical protein